MNSPLQNAWKRRDVLSLLPAAFSAGLAPNVAAGQNLGRKFIFVILRGGLDGLSALAPADDVLPTLRPGLEQAVLAQGPRLDLGNGFALHPKLKAMQRLYQQGDLAFVHAAATPYRGRSHFDGQDALETLGAPIAPAGAGEGSQGWLNRTLEVLGQTGLAIASAPPLALTGSASVATWTPPLLEAPDPQLLEHIKALYAQDAELARALTIGEDLAAIINAAHARQHAPKPSLQGFRAQMANAIGIMQAPGAPGVAMLSINRWDTHTNQHERLNQLLVSLDDGLATAQAILGPDWANTVIVVCSEFGRTVAENGTKGTDHGAGGLMMLAGGAVAGGRIAGDWPGLSPGYLLDGRDLAPANDVSSVLAGVLRDHLGIDRDALKSRIFPELARPMDGLVLS